MNVIMTESQEALAWRIEFVDRPLAAEPPFIRQPRPAWIRVERTNALELLRDPVVPEPAANGLALVFLPSGAATPFEVQKQAESWMASQPGEDGGTLEVQFRSERLLWRRGRAVCFGSLQAADGVCDAVTRFSFCEGDLASLERQVHDSWAGLEDDTGLLKRLSSRNLKREHDIDAKRRAATVMRLAYVRLQTILEKPPSDLSAPSRRLFLELALQADTLNRLRLLDNSIEVIEDFYWDLHEQFAEFRYFIKEYRVTLSIFVVLLLGELLVSIGQIWPWILSIAHWAQDLFG